MNKSYYAIIPANVRYDKDLPANAKLLYGEITALCNEKGYCWASNSYFAELYEVTVVTISRWIALLKKKGYIEIFVDKRDGNKRYIAIDGTGAINKIVNRYKQNNQDLLTKMLIGHNKNVNRGDSPNTDVDKDRDVKKVSNNTINNTDNNTFNSSTTGTEENKKDISLIAKSFESNGFGTINLTVKEMIIDLLNEYSAEWIQEAMKIAVKNNKRKLSYVEGILQNWRRNGGMKLGGDSNGTHRRSNESSLGQYEDIGITI